MTIQLVGGQYHGECRVMSLTGQHLRMPCLRPRPIVAYSESEVISPSQSANHQDYRDTGLETTVAGERRKVFIYMGR